MDRLNEDQRGAKVKGITVHQIPECKVTEPVQDYAERWMIVLGVPRLFDKANPCFASKFRDLFEFIRQSGFASDGDS